MIQITVKDLPCLAITPELAAALSAIGEDVSRLNYFTWPAGATNYGEAVLLMHGDDAATLAGGDRTQAVTLKFIDDTATGTNGQIVADQMYQIEHRPIHIMGDKRLVAVRLVDARYFFRGNMINTGYNVTVNSDRATYYEQSETAGPTAYTFTTLLNSILAALGIALTTTIVADISGAGAPTDYLSNGDRAADMLDRVCASLGCAFYARLTGDSGRYTIDTLDSQNPEISKTGDAFLADMNAGGTVYSAGDGDGKTWLNAIMPSTVTVIFPRQIPETAVDSAASSNPPVLNQVCVKTSTNGIPSGTTGRSGQTVVIGDNLWAIGPIGSETNATALQTRADFVAKAYYRRFKVNHTNARLRGWCKINPIPGEVTWRLTVGGPFTDVHTNQEWSIYGGDRDVVDGFAQKRVVGLGGLQTWKSFDGSLYIAGTESGKTVSFKVTSDFAAGTYWGRYKAKSYTPGTGTSTSLGTLASAEDLIIWNGAEKGLATQNNLLITPNTDSFAVDPCSGTVIGSETISGVTYRIVHAWIGYIGCEG